MAENDKVFTPRTSVAENLYRRYKRFWFLYLLIAAVCLGVGYAYIRYTIPSYSSTALLLIEGPDQNLSELQGPAAEASVKVAKNIDNEMAVLGSSPLIEQVVKDLHLYATIFY